MKNRETEKVTGSPWKYLQSEAEHQPEVDFTEKSTKRHEIDMTSMVDVTFLLLIFFMVTASFTLERAFTLTKAPSESPSPFISRSDDEIEFVEIGIDQFDTFQLKSRNELVEAASEQELRVRLQDIVASTGATKLKIVAHGDSSHAKFVAAWDAGLANQMASIQVRMSQ